MKHTRYQVIITTGFPILVGHHVCTLPTHTYQTAQFLTGSRGSISIDRMNEGWVSQCCTILDLTLLARDGSVDKEIEMRPNLFM